MKSKFLVVVGSRGIPSLVRVERDGSWLCVGGIFKVRKLGKTKAVKHVT